MTDFRSAVCTCGHGAGWHALAWLSWRKNKQTTAPCEHADCDCTGFVEEEQ